MGEARRTILVHIWDDKDEPNGLGFGMSGYGVDKDKIKCGKNEAGLRKSEGHKITFEINNRSSRAWLFPEDGYNGMWVGTDATDCPKSLPRQNPEFPTKDMKVSQDREQLEVKNLNTCKADYKFALNFVDADDPEKKLYQYDPIWANQNGGR